MRVIGNATALLVALSVMIGLLFMQKNYQNSWREPAAIQTSNTNATEAGGPEAATGYRVVMK